MLINTDDFFSSLPIKESPSLPTSLPRRVTFCHSPRQGLRSIPIFTEPHIFIKQVQILFPLYIPSSISGNSNTIKQVKSQDNLPHNPTIS